MKDEVAELTQQVASLKRKNRELDSKVIELYTLYNISKKLNLATQLDEIFTGIMEIIGKSLQIKDFAIMLLESDNNKLTTNAYIGDSNLKDVSLESGEGVSWRAVHGRETILVQDVSKEPDFLFYKGRKKDIGSFLCVPLKDQENSVLGVLNAHKPVANSFSEKDVELFEEVANQIAVAIEKAISFKNIKELSVKDDLTSLYNKRFFFEQLEKDFERSRRHDRDISLIMIDIDHFKIFNDTNGHPMGDMALKSVADTLYRALRKTDFLVRYGGEEFVVMLAETGKTISLGIAEKLRQAILNEKIEGEENIPGGKITATFGVSTYPIDAVYATELLDCADKALYQGKRKGRNRVVSYTEKLDSGYKELENK